MKGKTLAKTMGIDDFDGFQIEKLKTVIMKQVSEAFPYRELAHLLSEVPEKKKRMFSAAFNVKEAKKSISCSQLVQLIRMRTTKPSEKGKLIRGIYFIIYEIYEGSLEEITVEGHLADEETKIKEFGPWHYYWSLRLFPIEDDRIMQRMKTLRTELQEYNNSESETVHVETSIKDSSEFEVTDSKQREIIAKEREIRQQLEKEVDGLNKQLRQVNRSYDRLIEDSKLLEKEKEAASIDLENLKQALDEERLKTSTLDREKNNLISDLKKCTKTIEKLEEEKNQLSTTFEEQLAAAKCEDKSNFEEQIAATSQYEFESFNKEQVAPATQNERAYAENEDDIVKKVIGLIYLRMDNQYKNLKVSTSKIERDTSMTQMNDSLTLIDSLESFFFTELGGVHPVSINKGAEEAEEAEESEYTTKSLIEEVNEKKEEYFGTFYRRDHGGYIVGDKIGTFNIPESLVNTLGLEHEAGVSCTPKLRSSSLEGSLHYDIKLMLQGDDEYAPISKYYGYVEIGEHFTYYCVDGTNPKNRFPIHERDVQVQQPLDGVPCLFIVGEGSEYARLSKVFKESSEQNKISESYKNKTNTPSNRPDKMHREKFLEGCKIAIIGGVSKWFESVVSETGAELIHESGKHPERIHSQLKRANGLFMLLTAVSHSATWSCIEIAKQHKIPSFKIEGSKSYLRKLLWDNRDKLRGMNNMIQAHE